MTLKPNTNVWRDIFQLMEANPAVWKTKCVEYKNKRKKNEGWEAMWEKYKEIDQMQIYRYLKAFQSGDSEEVYVPSLWYFNDLEFLRRLEASMSTSTPDMDEEKIQIKRPRSDMKQDLLEQDFVYLETITRKENGVLRRQEEGSMSTNISTLDMDEEKIQTKRSRNDMNQELLEQEFVHLDAKF